MGDDGATNHHRHHRHSHQLQTAVTWVQDELERNQKKENHLNTISNMMGILVHLQLYTRVSQKTQKSEFCFATKPTGFHRLDEPPEKISAL